MTDKSLFRPRENCCAVAHAQRVAPLIDAAAYFEAFMCAAERAQRSILILAWDFDSRTPLANRGRDRAALGEFLNGLAKRRRKLHVRVLDWDYPVIFGIDREMSPLFGLSWRPHRRVHFRFDDTHPVGGSHHQKIVVIDDRLAFVGGLDLTSRRWDTPLHRPGDPRRVAGGKPYPPFHDVMVAVDGEAARELASIARNRWRRATGEKLAEVSVDEDPWPPGLRAEATGARVGIACTSPAGDADSGVRDVEQLYLDMIAAAQRYIYVENQYFTSHTLGEAIAARLAEPDGPEIVLVTRLLSHGWLEEMTMHVLRTGLIRRLRAADAHGRFHVYYPHVDGLEPGTCIDLHSKVMVVDDQWLRIGSSNMSNRSMGVDTECDVVIEAQDNPAHARFIRALRDRLLGEHLGVTEERFAAAAEQAGTMRGAVASLAGGARTLKPLEELTQWPEALVDAVSLTDPERPVSIDDLIAEFRAEEERATSGALRRNTVLMMLGLLALAAGWKFTPLADIVTPRNVIDWAHDFGGRWWAPLVIMGAYLPASIIMFPRSLITLAAVVSFNPWLAFLYSAAGNLIAAVAGFYAGRLMHRDTVRRIAGERLNRMCNVLRRRGLVAMTALRLVPLAPFTAESVVAGAIRIKLWHFVVGTFIGLLPGTIATIVFGSQIEAALHDPARVNYWVVAAVVLILAVGAVIVRRWFARMELNVGLQDAAAQLAAETRPHPPLPPRRVREPVAQE